MQSWGAENNQWLFSCSTVNCTVHEYKGHTNLWNNTRPKICSRRSNILFLLASGITYLKLPTHNAWLTQFNRCKDVCRWWNTLTMVSNLPLSACFKKLNNVFTSIRPGNRQWGVATLCEKTVDVHNAHALQILYTHVVTAKLPASPSYHATLWCSC